MGQRAAKGEKQRGRKAKRAQERAQERTALAAAALAAAAGPKAGAEVEVDLTELARPIPEPPPFEPATRMHSGYAPRMTDAPRVDDETLSDHLVNLQPLYLESDTRPERAAELEVEDASLRLDAPYLGSPLTAAPAESRRSFGMRVTLAAGGMFLALSSSYGMYAAVRDLRSADSAQRAAENVKAQPPQAAPVRMAAAQGATRQPADRASVEPLRAHAAPTLPSEPAPVALPATEPASAPPTTTDTTASPARGPRLTAPNVRTTTSLAAIPGASAASAASATPVAGAVEGAAASALEATLAPGAPSGPLPKRPSPSDVRASFRAIQDTIRKCAGGRKGLVTIRAVFAGSGQFTTGTIEGDFQNADERTCMTRAIFGLRLPPFEQAAFEVAFPLAL